MGRDKPTILLVHCHYRLPGGEDVVFAAERAMLERRGHRVVVYERSNEEPGLAARALMPLRAVFSLKAWREVRALIRSEGVDLVHVHNTLFAVSPSVFWAARSEKVPVVQTLHNFRLFCPAGVLLRDGRVCEDCPRRPGGLLCPVRHACYRQSRLQSAVCAGIYAFHRLLRTYRRVDLIALTDFDREKLLDFNARRRVFSPQRLWVKPNALSPDQPLPPPAPVQGRKNQVGLGGPLGEAQGLGTAGGAWGRLPSVLKKGKNILIWDVNFLFVLGGQVVIQVGVDRHNQISHLCLNMLSGREFDRCDLRKIAVEFHDQLPVGKAVGNGRNFYTPGDTGILLDACDQFLGSALINDIDIAGHSLRHGVVIGGGAVEGEGHRGAGNAGGGDIPGAEGRKLYPAGSRLFKFGQQCGLVRRE